MKKYLLLSVGCLFFISCKTNATLDKQLFNEDVLAKSISLDAVQLHGKTYMGQVRKTDSIYVYGNVPQTVIDSVMNARKLENKK